MQTIEGGYEVIDVTPYKKKSATYFGTPFSEKTDILPRRFISGVDLADKVLEYTLPAIGGFMQTSGPPFASNAAMMMFGVLTPRMVLSSVRGLMWNTEEAYHHISAENLRAMPDGDWLGMVAGVTLVEVTVPETLRGTKRAAIGYFIGSTAGMIVRNCW